MKAWLFWIAFTLCCVTLLPLVALGGRVMPRAARSGSAPIEGKVPQDPALKAHGRS